VDRPAPRPDPDRAANAAPQGRPIDLDAPHGRPIDLDAPSRTRIVLDSGASPFDRLDPDARRRLLVRVLCELVAYDDEVVTPSTPTPTPLTRV
jgi:hypothetical protein